MSHADDTQVVIIRNQGLIKQNYSHSHNHAYFYVEGRIVIDNG